jgi:hypothetical protein
MPVLKTRYIDADGKLEISSNIDLKGKTITNAKFDESIDVFDGTLKNYILSWPDVDRNTESSPTDLINAVAVYKDRLFIHSRNDAYDVFFFFFFKFFFIFFFFFFFPLFKILF